MNCPVCLGDGEHLPWMGKPCPRQAIAAGVTLETGFYTLNETPKLTVEQLRAEGEIAYLKWLYEWSGF